MVSKICTGVPQKRNALAILARDRTVAHRCEKRQRCYVYVPLGSVWRLLSGKQITQSMCARVRGGGGCGKDGVVNMYSGEVNLHTSFLFLLNRLLFVYQSKCMPTHK